MSSITDRIASVVAANMNDLFQNSVDASLAIDDRIDKLAGSLSAIREQALSLFDEERRAKDALDENAEKIELADDLARRSLASGYEDDARVFLNKKFDLTSCRQTLQATYDAAHEAADKMRALQERLEDEIAALKERKRAAQKEKGEADGLEAADGLRAAMLRAEAARSASPEVAAEARHGNLSLEEEVALQRLKEELARLGK